jgi:hypothetical protein
MTKLKIGDTEVRAEIFSNLAVYKQKGWRVRHALHGDWLGEDRVFENKDHAERFAWSVQERLNFDVKHKFEFYEKNGRLTREEYCAIADEEFERAKL